MKATSQNKKDLLNESAIIIGEIVKQLTKYQRRLYQSVEEFDFEEERDQEFFKELATLGFYKYMAEFATNKVAEQQIIFEVKKLLAQAEDNN